MKRLKPTLFWGVFFLYPTITLNVIQSVDCIRLGIGDDTFYLKKDSTLSRLVLVVVALRNCSGVRIKSSRSLIVKLRPEQ
jgi:hypothetical protein